MTPQPHSTPLPKLLVDTEGDPPRRTLKREGGGPLFSLTDEEWKDIRAGKYDVPQK